MQHDLHVKDPFMPTFGRQPRLFLDREMLLNDYITEILDSGDEINTPYQTTMISGVRGIGKTVFLSEIEKEFKRLNDWIVVDVRNTNDILKQIISQLRKKSKLNLVKLDLQIKRIKTKHLDVEITNAGIEQAMVLEEILKRLKKKHIKVLIGIDEAASTPELQDFAAIYQQLIRQDYSIALLMSGLPEDLKELKHNKVLTFLTRSNEIELSFLNANSIERTFIEYFKKGKRKIDIVTAHLMCRMTMGYAYAFQLLGHLVWKVTEPGDTINRETIEDVKEDYQKSLFNKVYKIIYQRLTPTDQSFLQAMAKLDKQVVKLKEITNSVRPYHSSNYWSVYRKRLIDFQLITPVEGPGKMMFCLPMFGKFLKFENTLDEQALQWVDDEDEDLSDFL